MTSMQRGGHAGPLVDIDFSTRRVLASYPDYASAQRMVDTLSDKGFDVGKTSIVGSDLLLVERVLGRMTTGRAAAAGAATGAWVGVFLGLIFGIATPYFWVPLIWGIVLGAAFGAAFGAAGHAAYRGTRDFASARTIVAQRYDVLVESERWAQASSMLGGIPQAPPQQPQPAQSTWPGQPAQPAQPAPPPPPAQG